MDSFVCILVLQKKGVSQEIKTGLLRSAHLRESCSVFDNILSVSVGIGEDCLSAIVVFDLFHCVLRGKVEDGGEGRWWR